MDTPAWISAICAVISVVAAIVGATLTTKHEKQAQKAATRANDLSEAMATAQSRIATSLEEERHQATKLNPNWEIIFSRGNIFFLINKNGEDAFDVHISTSSVYKPEKTEQSITAGSSVEIRGELGNTVNNNWVQVTWNRPPETQDGHRYTWQGSFPRQK